MTTVTTVLLHVTLNYCTDVIY